MATSGVVQYCVINVLATLNLKHATMSGVRKLDVRVHCTCCRSVYEKWVQRHVKSIRFQGGYIEKEWLCHNRISHIVTCWRNVCDAVVLRISLNNALLDRPSVAIWLICFHAERNQVDVFSQVKSRLYLVHVPFNLHCLNGLRTSLVWHCMHSRLERSMKNKRKRPHYNYFEFSYLHQQGLHV